MNIKDAAIVSAYTGFLCGKFSEMHKYTEELFERSVFTHEFGSEDFVKELKKLSKDDFVNLSKDLKD